MPPREFRAEPLDADDPSVDVDTEAAADSAPDSATEADDLAEAEARAEATRARATTLRKQADAASGALDESAEEEAPESLAASRRRLGRPGRKALAVAAAFLVSFGALAASGYVAWHHQRVVQQSQRSTEFARVARNFIEMMMSIDSSKARADVQRFADEATGQFKAGILLGAENMVRSIEESKFVAKATVQAAAVQSMTADSAVVLVAAKSELTKPDQPKPEIRVWRLVVDVETDAGKLKISKVEFVP